MLDSIILCGGFGMRLNAVLADVPKSMAMVCGRPFISHLLDQVYDLGIKRVILATGYLGESIENYLGYSWHGLEITYRREREPLGTGGAIRFAFDELCYDRALVMNGDSYFDTDLSVLIDAHKNYACDTAIALAKVPDASRYGIVALNPDNSIKSFIEKGKSEGPALINSGVYVFGKEAIESIPREGAVSLEYQVFPIWVRHGMHGVVLEGEFIDIGVTADLATARNFFRNRSFVPR